MSNQPLVAIDGATGYVGNHLAACLVDSGFNVRCIVHPGAKERDIAFLKSIGTEVFAASLDSADPGLTTALTGCDVAVHLIGSIAPKKGERLEDLHGAQSAALIVACKASGVAKIVMVTALGTACDAMSSYHRTKWQSEENVRKSGLQFVIVRPSLIIGRLVGQRDSKLIARYTELIRTRPAVPVIGGGGNKIQPVFVGDLAAAIQKFIESSQFDGQTLEIGGAEILTMKQFVEKLIASQGSHKKVRGVPLFAAGLMAAVCETVQDVPTVSRDQVKLSVQDNVCKANALPNLLGAEPTSVDQALLTYNGAGSTDKITAQPAR